MQKKLPGDNLLLLNKNTFPTKREKYDLNLFGTKRQNRK